MAAPPPPLLDPDAFPVGPYAYRGCRERPRWLVPSAVLGAIAGTLVAGCVAFGVLHCKAYYPSLYLQLPWPDHALPTTAFAILAGWLVLAISGFSRLRLAYGHAAITWVGTLIVVDLSQVYLAHSSECSESRCSELEREGALRLRIADLEWRAHERGIQVRPRNPLVPRAQAWFLIPAPDEASQTRVLALLEQETPAGQAVVRDALTDLAASGEVDPGGDGPSAFRTAKA
jgi:hypothetical protein